MALDKKSAQLKKERQYTEKLRQIMANDLPEFCFDYFIAIEPRTSILTRYNYAHDQRLFFQYLLETMPRISYESTTDFKLKDLDRVSPTQIEYFLNYLTIYDQTVKDDKDNDVTITRQNHEAGKARKLAAVRSLYKYFYKKERIETNPASLVDTPKIREKEIVRLEVDEIAKLLDQVESGEGLTTHAKAYHQQNRIRDIAMITLFLGTGIRISECINLNLDDIDFDLNGIRITRKGGKQAVVYFSDEVAQALKDYLVQRSDIEALPGHENALFLSMQKRRIGASALQNLVKKYSRLAAPLKKISPHKLRSTYGTQLYRGTGDIYLVAEVLGHRDVNTTKKHYAAIADDKRRSAANVVQLREPKKTNKETDLNEQNSDE